MKPLVFVTTDVPKECVRIIKLKGYRVKQGRDIVKGGKGAHAILTLLTHKVNALVMDAVGPQLKVISNMASGLDNIDLTAAKDRGVAVSNTPDVLTETVAEHTIAMVLALARRIVEGDSFVRKGKYKGWKADLLLGSELKGNVLGVVGHGRIGCRAAEIAQRGFGMKVLYYDLKGPAKHSVCGAAKTSLDKLLQEADAISLHVPLVPSTRHFISTTELERMKKTSFLVNTSRGPVIDEKALVKALQGNVIAGAGLDVFEKEPKIPPALTKLKNVVLTPHIASASREARGAMAEMAARNVITALMNL